LSLSEELANLAAMHAAGHLSDEEFSLAKQSALNSSANGGLAQGGIGVPPPPSTESPWPVYPQEHGQPYPQDAGQATKLQTGDKNKNADRAITFGWLTLLLGFFAGIPALVFGIKGRKTYKVTGTGGKWSIFGIIMGSLSIAVGVLIVVALTDPIGRAEYTGTQLASDVQNAVKDTGVTNVSCPDGFRHSKGEIADCTASDSTGKQIGLRVTFDDNHYHFTVEQQALIGTQSSG
jgi:hypothetical protein